MAVLSLSGIENVYTEIKMLKAHGTGYFEYSPAATTKDIVKGELYEHR